MDDPSSLALEVLQTARAGLRLPGFFFRRCKNHVQEVIYSSRERQIPKEGKKENEDSKALLAGKQASVSSRTPVVSVLPNTTQKSRNALAAVHHHPSAYSSRSFDPPFSIREKKRAPRQAMLKRIASSKTSSSFGERCLQREYPCRYWCGVSLLLGSSTTIAASSTG
jgi:hypothetical protein